MKPKKRCGLGKSERLRKRAEYLAASKKPSKRVETRHFLILLKENKAEGARIGITVTKKIGKAVTRNRIKRYVREFFRNNKSIFPKGYDVVVIARYGAERIGQNDVDVQLKTLVERPAG